MGETSIQRDASSDITLRTETGTETARIMPFVETPFVAEQTVVVFGALCSSFGRGCVLCVVCSLSILSLSC